MEQYQIVPWDDLLTEESSGINLEQYVPPELEQLAYEVCKSYAMDVKSMTLITSKPDKGGAIWRIETNHGPRSLKVLHRTPQRSLFSVGAQEYVVKNGARVPGIILAKDGANSVVAGGKLWIVTDWIDTLTQVAKIDLDGAMTLCHGLGEFHQWSKGYIPPMEAGKSSRIFKWESQYQKIMTKIGWFRHIANAYPDTTASPHLFSVLDMFENQAKEIFARFQASAYQKMIRKGEAHWGLAHQDYGWSNGQMGPGGIWVIDLDGVAYDLPIRDLRKIITSTMDDMGAWDLAWIRGVIDAYHRANPLDQETFELLWIDMAFPNEFYKHTKEVVFNPVEFMNTELDAILDRVVATEANKWEVLRELEKDKSNYPAGDYTEVEAAPSQPYTYRDYAKRGLPVEGASPIAAPKDERRIIRLVVNPDGKAVIFPGSESLEKKRRKQRTSPRMAKPIDQALAKPTKKQLKRRRKLKEKASKAEEAAKTYPQAVPVLKPLAGKKRKAKKLQKAVKPAAREQWKKVKPAAGEQVKKAKPVTAKPQRGKSAEMAKPQSGKSKYARPLLNRPTLEQISKLRTEPARRAAMKLLDPPKSAGKSKPLQGMMGMKPKSGGKGKGKLAPPGKRLKKVSSKAYISAYRTSAMARESII